MKQSQNPSAFPGKRPTGDEKHVEREGQESCRCKEASGKTPLELLKMMISDLSFWKKENRH